MKFYERNNVWWHEVQVCTLLAFQPETRHILQMGILNVLWKCERA